MTYYLDRNSVGLFGCMFALHGALTEVPVAAIGGPSEVGTLHIRIVLYSIFPALGQSFRVEEFDSYGLFDQPIKDFVRRFIRA